MSGGWWRRSVAAGRFLRERLMFRLMSILVLVLAVPALAVGPSMWRHTSEADFQPGTFENVVATNLGDLKLSRAIKTLLEQNPDVSSVYAIVESPDGVIYAGTGPRGVLMKIDNGEVSKVLNVPDQQIFSLLFDAQGRLLIGTGGELGRVLRIDKPGEEPVEIFSSEDVQYVWAMAEVEGTLYAATGPNGQLIAIDRDGKSRVLFDSHENNLLCMASDGKDMLYIGTDPNGLVYRVNRNNGDVYVLYDAAETEVGAIVIDRAGNVYAGTSAAIEGGAAVEQASQSQQGARAARARARSARAHPAGTAEEQPARRAPAHQRPGLSAGGR
jgi:ligand-binding sensor domain-containing protein